MTIRLADFEAGAKFPGDYGEALEAVQQRLARLQVLHIVHRRPAIIVIEGWDAAGKGGIVKRMTAQWDPRYFAVHPISAPTPDEKGRHFLYRFWSRLPAPGHVAVFDRSWYGRVLVERVEGFAAERDWRRGYDEINEFEAQQADAGVTIVKLFAHVTQAVQDRELRERLDTPWKQWKLGPEDLRNRARRADYVTAMEEMFKRTDTRWAPWHIIDGNNRKAARIAALTAVADRLEAHVPADYPALDPVFEQQARAVLGG